VVCPLGMASWRSGTPPALGTIIVSPMSMLAHCWASTHHELLVCILGTNGLVFTYYIYEGQRLSYLQATSII